MRPLDPRVLPHLTPARASLAGVVACGLASGLLLLAQAFALAGLVVGLIGGASSTAADPWDSARTAAVALAVVTALRALVSWCGDVLSARAAVQVTTRLRRRLLAAVLDAGPLGGSRAQLGEVALLSTRGMVALEPYLTRYLPTLVTAATLPVLTVLAIASQDWLSALVVVLTLPLVPVFAILIGLSTQEKADRQWKVLAQLSGHFVDVVRGLPTLVAYRRAGHQVDTIRQITHRYREATAETLKLGFLSSAALELIATLSVALVAVTVGLRLASGSLEFGTALVVLLMAPEAYWPLRRVGAEFHAAAEGTATFEEVGRVLDRVPAAVERAAPAIPSGASRAIRLDAVTVGYPGRDRAVLHDLSLSLPARGVTAIAGPSGCGKSTVLAVLAGDLRPRAGSLRVGGVPLDPDMHTDWQRQVSWVPQRPWIAAATVAENVRLARPEASDAAIWAALERVDLAETVRGLPQGLQTRLGEDGTGADGTGLSAGQRARLALARAVLAERPLVLLDEPTAHLDRRTEEVILETLTWLGERSCVVVVAHRDAVLALADQTVTLTAPAPEESRAVVRQRVIRVEEDVPQSAAGPTPSSPPPADTSASEPAEGRVRSRLVLGMALGAMSAGAGVALTATAGWLIARAAEQPPVLYLMVAIVAVRTFGLARPVLRYAERLVSHDTALRMLADRRADVFAALVPLTPGRLTRRRGDLLSAVVDDVDSLLDHRLRVQQPVATAVLVTVTAGLFAATQHAAVAVVVLTGAGSGGILAWVLAHRGVASAERRHVEGRAALSSAVVQTLHGAGDLPKWQATGLALDTVDRAASEVGAAVRRSARAVAAGKAAVLLTAGAAIIGVALVGGQAAADGNLSGPMLALLLLLPLALAEVWLPVADAGALAVRTAAADERLASLTHLTPLVTDPLLPRTPDLHRPEVATDDLAAGWGEAPPFRGLDLRLAPGARVGVVGPSGCGKSTLAAALLRFLDPLEGRVALAGTDLRDLRLDDVRRTVGLVDDDPYVFGSTVRENLRLARPDADDATLLRVLERTSLLPWVEALPAGLDERLGDGGSAVSGGERARLGLARALLADTPVLVLDEPTAHLDTATARSVTQDLLADATRSVVWITHTTVGLDLMDQVVDLGEVTRRSAAQPTSLRR